MNIKALILDVDGTMTDGGIYIGNDGEVMKKFSVKDGYAINNILPRLNIVPIIITGRKSKIVEYRCNELNIKNIIQGSHDKVADMKKILENLNIDLMETAYIGDDVNDLDAMKLVGLVGCPNDAVKEIKEIANYITSAKGGEGAVREFCEWISATECLL